MPDTAGNSVRQKPDPPSGDQEPVARRLRSGITGHGKEQTIPRRKEQGSAPASFAQQRLWFLDRLLPESPVYNIALAIRLKGRLNRQALEGSLNELVGRHEALRTTFSEESGQVMQVIAPRLALPLPVTDLGRVPEGQREAETRRLCNDEARRPFDLHLGPLVRAGLLALSPDEHILLLTMHHTVSDGWSVGILMRELAAVYNAHMAGEPSPLQELPLQYADYALWQRQWMQGQVLQKELAYWREKLAGLPPTLELPTDYARPPAQTAAGAHQEVMIPRALRDALRALSTHEKATLFMTLLAAYQTLLHRYTGQDDIVVGTPIASRGRPELGHLVGFFVNTLALRSDLSGNPSFRHLLGRVREAALEAYEHQDMPFDKLVEELRPERDPSRTPLFQTMFALQDVPQPALEMAGLVPEPETSDAGTAMFDLTLSLWPARDGLAGYLEYSTDLYRAETIERLARHFRILLEGIAADPDQPISTLPLLSQDERRQVLVGWNTTRTGGPAAVPVPELIRAQAERGPEAIAVVLDDQGLTYGEMDRRANQLARYLQGLGVGPDTPVGLCAERSPEAVMGLLAILKAGGAYLPLDPAYPEERLELLLADSRTRVVLTQERMRERLPAQDVRLVYLDADREAAAKEDGRSLPNAAAADDLAYIIYTSGSTGTPKGVLITNAALAAHCRDIIQHYQLTASDTVLQFASLAFDASLEQILPTLAVGAKLALRGPDLWTPSEFGPKAAALGVTVANLPTPYWHQLAREWAEPDPQAAYPPLRLVIAGGDVMRPDGVAGWRKAPMAAARLLNAYGPTETTITATTFEVPVQGGDLPWRTVPIGRPLPYRRAYILGKHGEPVPIGVPGELYIGGMGLARGYLNRPDQTEERFVPDPFAQEPGARMYRTGDLARYLPDGNIEFLGRVDGQVKVRGYRVELGEIEAVLAGHPAVREAAVVAREDTPGDKRLVAYVTPRAGQPPAGAELRAFLRGKLPDFMVPAAFAVLDALPWTPGGKIDQQALPSPSPAEEKPADSPDLPHTPLEEELAGLWAELLGVEQVGTNDIFFDLGGHSLLATQLISRVEETCGVAVPLRGLFEAPTIAGLALLITQQMAEQAGGAAVAELEEVEQLPEGDAQAALAARK